MKRNTLLILLVVAAGLVLVLNPLQFLHRGGPARASAPAAVVGPLASWAESAWQSPEDYVLAAFSGHDLVLLGEMFKIRQNVMLVHDLIPRLYAAGIRDLGVEYALSDDQPRIDALLTAPSWDEAAARAITFDWLVTWGYQEYVDLYHAAWEVNHRRPAGAPPFRIVGLNVRVHWDALQQQKDLADPSVVARLYADGLPEVHMADVIDRELTRAGRKALIFCGTQHVFTRYRSRAYEKNANDRKLADVRRMGAIVYDRIGSRVFSISLHAPWPDPAQPDGLTWAAGGAIDGMISALPADKQSGGWSTAGTPLGALPLAGSAYSEAGAETLADLFDGYVIQGPLSLYSTVTPIPGFIGPADAARAGREYPGVKPGVPPTAAQLNQAISDDLVSLSRALTPFR